ncbi:hypothetical protein AVEN_45688-1, partial [Araneus ventricosus]
LWRRRVDPYTLEEEIRRSRRLQQLPPEYVLYNESAKRTKKIPDDTEVKELKLQPAVFTPALFWEPRKPTIFKGEPGQDPTKWLQEYLRISKFNQWDDTLALANAYIFLDGTAKKWFDNNKDLLTSWEVFQTELKKVFGDAQLY